MAKFAGLGAGLIVAGIILVVALKGENSAAQEDGVPQGPPPADVRVATAVIERMAPQIRVPGTVVSPNDSRIAAQETGMIVSIADVGTILEAGDEIARIDDRQLLLEEAQNEARIRQLEAQLRYESQQVARYEELAATNNTPQARLEEAVANRETVAQDLTQAKVALQRTRLQIERTRIRTPFPGQVVARLAQIGEYATPGREIARIVDTGHVEIRAQVPFSMAETLAPGAQTWVLLANGPEAAHLRAVVGAGDEVTRTLEIRVVPPRPLPIGSAVELLLSAGEPRNVVAVPRDALILRPGQTYIWTVGAGESVSRVAVATGASAGDLIEVLGDVVPGDRVVIRGGERLQPGQQVRISGSAEG